MATRNILAIHEAITPSFPNVSGNPGVVACRPIANTNPPKWSQHAFGNATDYTGSKADLELLYWWLVVQRGRLPIGTVCFDGKGGCTTAHRTHLHVDALHMTGTPACAGGTATPPGVRQPIFDIDKTLFGSDPLGALGLGGIVNPIGSVVDFLQLLTDPVTYLRVLLFVGGSALLLMGLAALLLPMGIDLATKLPTGAGTVARVGQAVGGSK